MKMLAMLPLLLFTATSAVAAVVAPIDGDNCDFSADTQSTNHLADIPDAILKKLPRMGDSIPPVQHGDVMEIPSLPGEHLIRAFWRDERWVIVYSNGGSASSRRAAVLDMAQDGTITQITNAELWRYPGGACQAVDVGFEAKRR